MWNWGNATLNGLDWYLFRPACWNITGRNCTLMDVAVNIAGTFG